MFKGRELLIATRHGKEQVIRPILENSLGVHSIVSSDFDTDLFGTFTGEVSRADSPVDTLRKKCLYGMEQTGADLAVASEGSFGPHPHLYMLTADEEWIILIDKKNDLEIIAREISTDTNFNGQYVDSFTSLLSFAESASFPSHGLILRDQKEGVKEIVKGICDTAVLSYHFERMHRLYQKVYVETDMRAMHNPTRMQVIEKVTYKLVEKIHRCCPACGIPGFDIGEVIRGLPCSNCTSPTRSVKTLVYTCKKCAHQEFVHHPDDKEREDPMYCDYCNP